MGETLLEQYGRIRVAQIVSSFYRDVLRSPRLGHFFADASIQELVDHQAVFMQTAMGGPAVFSDEHLSRAHAHLDIAKEDFDEMMRLLEVNLLRFDVTPEDAAQVVAEYRIKQSHLIHH